MTKLARLRLSSRGLDDDDCSDCCVLGGARSSRLPNTLATTLCKEVKVNAYSSYAIILTATGT